MDVGDLLCQSVVFLGGRLPVSNQILDHLEALGQVVQSYEHSNVLLALVIRYIDLNTRLLEKLLFGLLLPQVLGSNLLDESRELHHVDLPSGDLLSYEIVLLAFSNQVRLHLAKEGSHVRVVSDHLLEALHSIHFHKLALKALKHG